MMEIPYGYKFRPTDEQLIVHYLMNKVTGKPLPVEGVIVECDLYGDPSQIFANFNSYSDSDSECHCRYFFTKLKKKTAKGSRIDRTLGNGSGAYWRLVDKKPVFAEDGRVIEGALKRSLVFYNKNEEKSNPKSEKKCSKSKWLMKEYSVDERMEGIAEEFKHFVLCCIRRQKQDGDDVEEKESQRQPKRARINEKKNQYYKEEEEKVVVEHVDSQPQLEIEMETMLSSSNATKFSYDAQARASYVKTPMVDEKYNKQEDQSIQELPNVTIIPPNANDNVFYLDYVREFLLGSSP